MKIDSDIAEPPPPQPSDRFRRFLKLFFRICGAFLLLLAIFLLVERLNSRHPHLGRIYHTSARDLYVARANPLAKHLSDILPRSVTQSEFYPDRLKVQPKFLRLGEHQLEWSIGGPQTGWLYFWNVDHMPRAFPWQFARTDQTNFAALQPASIPATFIGPADLPASAPATNAIQVAASDILFARHIDETNRIYILHLAHQNEGKLSVRYCKVDFPSP